MKRKAERPVRCCTVCRHRHDTAISAISLSELLNSLLRSIIVIAV